MATGTADGAPSRRVDNRRRKRKPATVVEYGKYIDDQLNRTGGQVKGSDLFGGLLSLATGSLAYLLVVVLVDHWVVPGGLGFWSRLLACAGFVMGAGAYLALFVFPPLLRQVNPVFAAHTIERAQPGLKNSLVNFLLLKPARTGMPAPVYEAIEEQAATGLVGVSVESAVDRSHLVRIGMILLGIVTACALYIVLSPKDPLASAARVIIPWADIDRPTRISVENVRVEVIETGHQFAGGDAAVVVGQHVKISASIRNRGLNSDESAVVRFSTLDSREIVDQQVSMEQGEYLQYIVLPTDNGGSASQHRQGLRQSIEYFIHAGDAVEGPFRIEAAAAPTIEVTALDYEYPAYTRLPALRVEGQGDVRALEGTQVTVRARANQDIQNATIDFDCDGHSDRALSVDGREASATFVLQLREDRTTPAHDSYLLRFTNQDGHENRQPVRYRIEVTPDLPPEIEFTAPEAPGEIDELSVVDTLPLAVRATDRDFDLVNVVLRAELAGTDSSAENKRLNHTLLEEPRIDQFRSEPYRFVPRAHGFEAGDTVIYWAEARDNRRPDANVATTQRFRVKIVPPPDKPQQQRRPEDNAGQPPDADQQPEQNGDEAQQPRQDDPNADERPEEPNGEAGEGDDQQQGVGGGEGDGQRQQGDTGGGQQTEPDAGDGQPADEEGVDPDSQDGDAFQRIMEHMQQQQSEAGGNKPADPGTDESQQPNPNDTPPDTPDGAGQPGQPGDNADAAPSDQPPADDQSAAPADAQNDANRQPDDQSGTDATPDDGSAADKSTGGETADQSDQSTPNTDQETGDNTAEPSDAQDSAENPRQAADGITDRADDAAAGDPKQTDQGAGQERDQTGASDQHKGSPGDGQTTPDENRSPDPQGGNAPKDKQPDGNNAAGDETPQTAESPSNSPHESDTEGRESGDRSGEGQKGGGQRADQEGSGAAGRNKPSDQGAGAAQEPGEGDTADRPGDKKPSGDASDDSEQQTAGDGNKTRPGTKNTDAGRQQTGQPDDAQPGAQQTEGQPDSAHQLADQPGAPGEKPNGGGLPGERNGAEPASADQPAPRGADPNLDYAKKATDLVLENLNDQLAKDKPDQQLLDKLKWSREDLQRFVDRWEQMRQAAGTPGEKGQQASQELDAALRGLGLRRRSTSIQADSTSQDQVRGLRQTGRTQPPSEYSELYKQYTTGTAKGLPSQRK